MSFWFSYSVTSSDFRLPFELKATLGVWGLQICDQVSCFLDKPKALKMGILRGAGWPTAGIEVDYCHHADSSNIKDRPTIKMGTMNWTWGYISSMVSMVSKISHATASGQLQGLCIFEYKRLCTVCMSNTLLPSLSTHIYIYMLIHIYFARMNGHIDAIPVRSLLQALPESLAGESGCPVCIRCVWTRDMIVRGL